MLQDDHAADEEKVGFDALLLKLIGVAHELVAKAPINVPLARGSLVVEGGDRAASSDGDHVDAARVQEGIAGFWMEEVFVGEWVKDCGSETVFDGGNGSVVIGLEIVIFERPKLTVTVEGLETLTPLLDVRTLASFRRSVVAPLLGNGGAASGECSGGRKAVEVIGLAHGIQAGRITRAEVKVGIGAGGSEALEIGAECLLRTSTVEAEDCGVDKRGKGRGLHAEGFAGFDYGIHRS